MSHELNHYHESDLGKIYHGDNIKVLKTIESASVDLMVTDPPFGYGFMGLKWDKAIPPVALWKECLRVMKPGAFAFVMSAPRQDVMARMIINLEDAGFVTNFSSVYWTYASGWPKAVNISKAVDKKAGDGKAFEGAYGGFQPKPAVEVVLVAMKPMDEKTFVDQALKNGKGVTWLGKGTIPYVSDKDRESSEIGFEHPYMSENANEGWKRPCHENYENWDPNEKGRFPANLLVSDDVLNDGKVRVTGETKAGTVRQNRSGYCVGMPTPVANTSPADAGSFSRYFDIDKWFDEKMKNLPPEVKLTFPFLIVAKPSKTEKNKGLERLSIENDHSTVKPIKLKSYLITIGGRPGDVVLDPNNGSGTTPTACEMLGYKYIAIDEDEHSCDIAAARVADEGKQKKLFVG